MSLCKYDYSSGVVITLKFAVLGHFLPCFPYGDIRGDRRVCKDASIVISDSRTFRRLLKQKMN